MKTAKTLFLAALSVCAAISTVEAQTASQVTGNVTDKSGSAVPGAEIMVVSGTTGTERKGTTDETGS